MGVWEQTEQTAPPFFSGTMGAAHRMPNGNTLIIESDNGRVFEVTAEHETVWEFHNPHRAGERNELIAVVFDMFRLPCRTRPAPNPCSTSGCPFRSSETPFPKGLLATGGDWPPEIPEACELGSGAKPILPTERTGDQPATSTQRYETT